jgi:hypothetical protein
MRLLIYYCFTAALLLLYCCFTADLLLSRLSKRVKEVVDKMRLLIYYCFTAALLLLYCCQGSRSESKRHESLSC